MLSACREPALSSSPFRAGSSTSLRPYMNRMSWYRAVPALVTAALLVGAALGSRSPVRACCQFSAPVLSYPRCDSLLQHHGGASTATLTPNTGITQPVLTPGNFPACSVTFGSVSQFCACGGRIDVVQ